MQSVRLCIPVTVRNRAHRKGSPPGRACGCAGSARGPAAAARRPCRTAAWWPGCSAPGRSRRAAAAGCCPTRGRTAPPAGKQPLHQRPCAVALPEPTRGHSSDRCYRVTFTESSDFIQWHNERLSAKMQLKGALHLLLLGRDQNSDLCLLVLQNPKRNGPSGTVLHKLMQHRAWQYFPYLCTSEFKNTPCPSSDVHPLNS